MCSACTAHFTHFLHRELNCRLLCRCFCFVLFLYQRDKYSFFIVRLFSPVIALYLVNTIYTVKRTTHCWYNNNIDNNDGDDDKNEIDLIYLAQCLFLSHHRLNRVPGVYRMILSNMSNGASRNKRKTKKWQMSFICCLGFMSRLSLVGKKI